MPSYRSDDPVHKLPLVGPAYAHKLARLGVNTIMDLIFHLPFRYEDTRNIITINDLGNTGEGTIQGEVTRVSTSRTRTGKWLTTAKIQDDTGSIEAIWFNQPYLQKSLIQGEHYLLSGKIYNKWGRQSLSNPDFELVRSDTSETTHLARLTPIYPETAGVSSKWLRSRIKLIKDYIPKLVDDYLTEKIRAEYDLIDLPTAIQFIHFPEEEVQFLQARHRLGLDEMIEIQLKVQQFLQSRRKFRSHAIPRSKQEEALDKLTSILDFILTTSQKKAIEEIFEDLTKAEPMNRLLNGDVGSGKTIVAFAAAAYVCTEGHTAVIMAPTTILAGQHYDNAVRIMSQLDIPVTLVTSDTKGDLKNSGPQLIIGTHALLFDEQLPPDTALVVIDEQHRFGVSQRRLLAKSQADTSPHYLTMTATPIPRSLTMALFGYTDVSILDELPKGRIPVKTHVVPQDKREAAYDWIKQRLSQGEQAFVICPLIEESEILQAKSAKEEFEELKEVFTDTEIDIIHGQLTSKHKDQALERFRSGQTQILVATPVIEVGIDIPNATTMIIEDSERFGLAQLHQLRGRIGRGHKQSYCLLFTRHASQDAKKRLEYFSRNNSGFKVAEFDLRQRGPGEVFGLRQSGILKLRFADLSDRKMIKTAQTITKLLTEQKSSPST